MAKLLASLLLLALVSPTAISGAADRPGNAEILVVGHAAQWPGKILVNHDEWALADAGFSVTPEDARNFALNVGAWFTGGRPGRFLVYSGSFGLRGQALASVMRGAGHSWTVSLAVPFTLENLLQYQGVFLANHRADPDVLSVLIDYVRAGGNVYLAGGTFAEASLWNPFLNAFGLGFQDQNNGLFQVILPITSNSALLQGVGRLLASIGNDIDVLDPANPDNHVIGTYAGHVLLATYEGAAIPVPVDLRADVCPNRLNTGSREILRVVVFGTPDLDAAAVDPASIRLLGVPPLQSYLVDVGGPTGPAIGKTDPTACSRAGRDGLSDLVLTFRAEDLTGALTAHLGRAPRHDEILAITLTGHLKPELGRSPVVGEDLIVVNAPGKKAGR